MGMYTQIRGWLNVDSISYGNFNKIKKIFDDAVNEYNSVERTPRQVFAVQDTHIKAGGNGSAFIFIGTEFKNYDEDAEKWLKFIISKFWNAEGHIMFQYEEDEGTNKVWIVNKTDIKEQFEDYPFWIGYGNTYRDFINRAKEHNNVNNENNNE